MQQKQKRKQRMRREEFMRKATDVWLSDIIPNFAVRTEVSRAQFFAKFVDRKKEQEKCGGKGYLLE